MLAKLKSIDWPWKKEPKLTQSERDKAIVRESMAIIHESRRRDGDKYYRLHPDNLGTFTKGKEMQFEMLPSKLRKYWSLTKA